MAHHEAGGAVIMSTHHMRLAAKVDHIVMLRDGQIALQGPPVEFFRHADRLRGAGLDVPMTVALSGMLGYETPALRVRELARRLLDS
jgi:energy-coupling factor transporter ATP-binding protein EcfA2